MWFFTDNQVFKNMEQIDIFSAITQSKQEAMDLFERTRKEFLGHCRWVAKRIYQQKGNVCIDDVREQVQLPDGVNGKVFGAVFNSAEWERVGYTQTKIKTSHSRTIGVFRLVIYLLVFLGAAYAALKPVPVSANSEVAKELVALSRTVHRADLRKEAERKHEVRVQRVKRFLVQHDSPMAGNAEDFVSSGERYGVDYRLVVAISGKESTFGKYQLGNNPFGWSWGNLSHPPGQRFRTFASFSDAISVVTQGLAEGYKGLNLGEIAYRYAPPSENNTEKWIADVREFMKEI